MTIGKFVVLINFSATIFVNWVCDILWREKEWESLVSLSGVWTSNSGIFCMGNGKDKASALSDSMVPDSNMDP